MVFDFSSRPTAMPSIVWHWVALAFSPAFFSTGKYLMEKSSNQVRASGF
jgi:hypothetical protein